MHVCKLIKKIAHENAEKILINKLKNTKYVRTGGKNTKTCLAFFLFHLTVWMGINCIYYSKIVTA